MKNKYLYAAEIWIPSLWVKNRYRWWFRWYVGTRSHDALTKDLDRWVEKDCPGSTYVLQSPIRIVCMKGKYLNDH